MDWGGSQPLTHHQTYARARAARVGSHAFTRALCFGMERRIYICLFLWSFVQAASRISATLPDAWWCRVGWHFHWLNVITDDTDVFILLKLDAWALRINGWQEAGAKWTLQLMVFWLKELKVVWKHLEKQLPSRVITCDYLHKASQWGCGNCHYTNQSPLFKTNLSASPLGIKSMDG